MSEFSHLDSDGNPTMVDVGGKQSSRRVARARSIVRLPDEVYHELQADDIVTKKGSVFQTARLAGIMGVKKTSELIPLCHPLAIDSCSIEITSGPDQQLWIDCEVSIEGKTGVEMEALTGATVAALTVYDMCKALSHDIEIVSTKLMEKSGGKRDFLRSE